METNQKAGWISRIFNPYTSLALALAIAVYSAHENPWEALLWSLILIIIILTPPAFYTLLGMRRGRITDFFMSRRTDRSLFYIAGAGFMLTAILILNRLGSPRPILLLLISLFTIDIVDFLINNFWKISLHSAAMGIVTALTWYYFGTIGGLFALLLTLAVMWSREKLTAHSWGQTIAGAFVGFTITWLTYFFLL